MSFRHPVIFCHFTPHTIQFSMSSRRSQLGRRWCMWYASFICVLWLMYMCAMTHMYAMRDWHSATLPHAQSSPRCVHVDRSWVARDVRPTCTCDMPHPYVYYDSFICVPWLVCMPQEIDILPHILAQNPVFDERADRSWGLRFIHVTWLIQMCAMTYAYVFHDSNVCYEGLKFCHPTSWKIQSSMSARRSRLGRRWYLRSRAPVSGS